MEVRVDTTVGHLTESKRSFDPAHRVLVMTKNGDTFDISEDTSSGKLTVRTTRGVIVVTPQAANVIRVSEERF